MAEKELDPRLLDIMKETGTNLSGDDLSALKSVSVKELIKLWEVLGQSQEQPTGKGISLKSSTSATKSKKEIFEEWTKGVVENFKKETEKKAEKSSSSGIKPKIMNDVDYSKVLKEARANLRKRISLDEQTAVAVESNDSKSVKDLTAKRKIENKSEVKLRTTPYYETLLKKKTSQVGKLVKPSVIPQIVTVNDSRRKPTVVASKQLGNDGSVYIFLEVATEQEIRDLLFEQGSDSTISAQNITEQPNIEKITSEDFEGVVYKVDPESIGEGGQVSLKIHYTEGETGERKTNELIPIQLGFNDTIESEQKETNEFESAWFKTGQKNETKETVSFEAPLQEAVDSFIESTGLSPISEIQRDCSSSPEKGKHTMQFFSKRNEKPILVKVVFAEKPNGVTDAIISSRSELDAAKASTVKGLKKYWEGLRQNKTDIIKGHGIKIKIEKTEKEEIEKAEKLRVARKKQEEDQEKLKKEQEEQERLRKEAEEKERLRKEAEEQERLRLAEQERLRKQQEELERLRKLQEEEEERIRKEAEEQERLRKEAEELERLQREQEELEMQRQLEEERLRLEQEELERQRLEEEERMRLEAEELERLRQEEEERIRQEQEELERIRKEQEEQDRLLREQEEKERLRLAEQERLRKEQERQEQERLRKESEEQERLRKEAEEQERLRLAEEERIRKEQEEQERLRLEQEEQERIRLAEEERLRKEQEELERQRQEEEERIKREAEEQERLIRDAEEQERLRIEQEKLRIEQEERDKVEAERLRVEEEKRAAEELILQAQKVIDDKRNERSQKLVDNMEEFWKRFGKPLKSKEFMDTPPFLIKIHTLKAHQAIEIIVSPPQEGNTCYKNIKVSVNPLVHTGVVVESFQVIIDELYPNNSPSSVAIALRRKENFPTGIIGELKIEFDEVEFNPSNDEIVGEEQANEASFGDFEFKFGDLVINDIEHSDFEEFKALWAIDSFGDKSLQNIYCLAEDFPQPVDLVKRYCGFNEISPLVHVKEGADEGTTYFGASMDFPSGDSVYVLLKCNAYEGGLLQLKVQAKSVEEEFTQSFMKSTFEDFKKTVTCVEPPEPQDKSIELKVGKPVKITQKRVVISKPNDPKVQVSVTKAIYPRGKSLLKYHIRNLSEEPLLEVKMKATGEGFVETFSSEAISVNPGEEGIIYKVYKSGEGAISSEIEIDGGEGDELCKCFVGESDTMEVSYPTLDFFQSEWNGLEAHCHDEHEPIIIHSSDIGQVVDCCNSAFAAEKALNQQLAIDHSLNFIDYSFHLVSGEEAFVKVNLELVEDDKIKCKVGLRSEDSNSEQYHQSLVKALETEVFNFNELKRLAEEPAIPPVEEEEEPAIPPVEEEEEPAIPPVEEEEEPAIPPVEEEEEPAIPPVEEEEPPVVEEEPAIPPVEEEEPAIPPVEEEEPVIPPVEEEEPPVVEEEPVVPPEEPPVVEEPPVIEEKKPELPPPIVIEEKKPEPPVVVVDAPKKPVIVEEDVFEEEERVIKENAVDASKLSNPSWLKPRFNVSNTQGSSTDKRIWEIDFFASIFRVFDKKGGKLKSTYHAKDLYSLERHFTDSRRSTLRFFGDKNPHELVFETNYHRERFFECSSCMRKNLFVWCPSVCGEGQTKCITDIKGTFVAKENGKPVEYKGQCKVNAYAKPFESIKVFTMTWNMGGKKAPKDPKELQDILIPGKYDLYAIATQETGFPKDVNKFKAYVENCLGEKYIVLTCMTMWEIQLVVLSKKSHFLKISNIQGVQKATGLGKLAANKGGVGISLCFNNTPMLFISAHLAANHSESHEDNDSLNLRNQNAREIIDAMTIGNPTMDIGGQFDYIFFMGDTNYRVQLPYDQAVALAKNKQYDELLKSDQLRMQQKQGVAFYGFKESAIKFPPTYKYKAGTLEFDTKKKRSPSYTDRILFKTFPASQIVAEKYTAKYPECKHPSDHLPVQCIFKIPTHRPFVSVFTSDSQFSCQIIFDSIICKLAVREDIKTPTVTFYAPWLDSNEKGEYPITSPIPNTRKPEWSGTLIPLLTPATSDMSFLRLQHIALTIRSGKPDIKTGIDNLIGTVVLPLQNAVLKSPDAHQFKAPINAQGGLAAGIMEGSYRIVYKKEDLSQKLMNVDIE